MSEEKLRSLRQKNLETLECKSIDKKLRNKLEKQVDKAIVKAKKRPKVSLPIWKGIRLTHKNKMIMEVARRLANQ